MKTVPCKSRLPANRCLLPRRRRLSPRVIVVCWVVMVAFCLIAQSGAAEVDPPDADDLMVGEWVVQPHQSQFCKDAPEQSVRQIADMGWGLLETHWTGLDHKGAPVDVCYVSRFDGLKYPGNILKRVYFATSWKFVNPHRIEFEDWSKDNKVIGWGVRTISKDGQTMTQTVKVPGKACVEVQVFARR